MTPAPGRGRGRSPMLSLRPVPLPDGKPKNLGEFIAWANSQPGGFRELDSKKLEEEIKTEAEARRRAENGEDEHAEGEDVEMQDAPNEEETVEEETAEMKLQKAREEMFRSIDVAGNNALLTLDFLSLLLSKQNPTAASVTLSQQLRDMVGIGTMGSDRLVDSNITPEKIKDQETVGSGWMLMEIQNTRAAAENAGKVLEREVIAEAKFWKEIMAVQETGWSICRMPNERQSLGVRFGFTESAPEFRNKGLAPMRRNEDGSVHLDCGRLGGVSERLLVSCYKDGHLQGRSYLPALTTEDAPLHQRVLEARNTLLSQELWHEMTKEARTLLPYGVTILKGRICCEVEPGTNIYIQLVPLRTQAVHDASLQSNSIAEAIAQAIHILISYAHRTNELTRTRPYAPTTPRPKVGSQTYALFRPIISRITSFNSLGRCTDYIGSLVQTLQRAGFPASFILLTPEPAIIGSPNNKLSKGPNELAAPHSLVRNIISPIDFIIHLKLLQNTWFNVRGRTFLYPIITTYYNVTPPISAPVAAACPPFKDGYSDLRSLAVYLRTVAARVLAEAMLAILNEQSLPSEEEKKPPRWAFRVGGIAVEDNDNDGFHMDVDLKEADGKPVIILQKTVLVNEKPESRKWIWSTGDKGEKATLRDVVTEAATKPLSL